MKGSPTEVPELQHPERAVIPGFPKLVNGSVFYPNWYDVLPKANTQKIAE